MSSDGSPNGAMKRPEIIELEKRIVEGDRKLHGRVDEVARETTANTLAITAIGERLDGFFLRMEDRDVQTAKAADRVERALENNNSIITRILTGEVRMLRTPSRDTAKVTSPPPALDDDDDTGFVAKATIGGSDLKAFAGKVGSNLRLLFLLVAGSGIAGGLTECAHKAAHVFTTTGGTTP